MRTARTTILIAVVLALPYLVVGLWSDGSARRRLIGGGIILLVVSGLAAAFMAWRGKRIDETQDERQTFIVGNAMRFSFCVMAVAVQAYWAWQFASQGNAGDSSFWLLVALWARSSAASSTTRPDTDQHRRRTSWRRAIRRPGGTDAKKKTDALVGYWIAIGAGVGLTFGALFGQIGLGIALGAGVGIVIGSVLAAPRRWARADRRRPEA